MMKIIAFTKYSYEGPSSRYRFYNYRDCFKSEGIELRISPLFDKKYFAVSGKIGKLKAAFTSYMKRIVILMTLLIKSKEYDLVLIEYELFPYVPPLFEWLLHLRNIRYLVDYDDAIFHKYDLNTNSLVRSVLRGKIATVMKYAEQVIVCNAYLESYAQQYNKKTFRLPTVVLLDKYKQAMEEYKKEEGQPFIIGWIGSKSTSVYVLDILLAMEKFAKKYNARFNLIGFDSSIVPADIQKQCQINTIRWMEETEITEILRFDIGIMPLPDDPWSNGKCGFKLVQYMSCQKPVIASPVGINCYLVEEEKNGFLPRTNDEWFNAFEKLYLDVSLRQTMGRNNLEKIESEYNHTKNCSRYVELIRTIMKG